MKFGKSISRLLAKFVLVSMTASCFGCCSYAMEDETSTVKKSQTRLRAEEILRNICYKAIVGGDFRKLVENMLRTEYSNPTTITPLDCEAGSLALYMLTDEEEFSALLSQFAEYYVEKTIKKTK